jgi:hypothetical protein
MVDHSPLFGPQHPDDPLPRSPLPHLSLIEVVGFFHLSIFLVQSSLREEGTFEIFPLVEFGLIVADLLRLAGRVSP